MDNIKIEDPCIIERDSILFVVSRKSEILSINDLPDIDAEMADMEDIRYYQVWLPGTIYQTPNDFFDTRRLSNPGRVWSALYEIVNPFDCLSYNTTFLSNLQLVWKQNGVARYDFINQPNSFLLVLQQDCQRKTEGFGGNLSTDVSPIYVSRVYRSYICPVQKRYRLKL
ncbi:MAG: hypothetical protein MJY50_03305 [Bacteroidales bacterium]|nr:hypothetical protein [Bacteroidales bacterium]